MLNGLYSEEGVGFRTFALLIFFFLVFFFLGVGCGNMLASGIEDVKGPFTGHVVWVGEIIFKHHKTTERTRDKEKDYLPIQPSKQHKNQSNSLFYQQQRAVRRVKSVENIKANKKLLFAAFMVAVAKWLMLLSKSS